MLTRHPFSPRSLCLSLLVAALACSSAAAADKAELPNLLRLPTAKIEETTAPAVDREQLGAVADDNAATVAMPHATADAPLELVYGFGGATVAPERLVVQLPASPEKGTGTARVEVLASLVSSHAGFQVLRSDPLKQSAGPQEFKFPPAAAKWVMLRFTPPAGADRAAVAEVALFGRDGPPQSNYAFKQSPAAAVKVLGKLKTLSALDVQVSPDESALFADVKDGGFGKWSFEEASLLASGVTDAAKRREYLARTEKLVEEARKATADAATPFAKGERLLKHLHAGPLAKGYEAEQTSLAAVLDTGKYNCVSSAALYNVVGRRLGLDLRAIEVPDHAFSILYDGTRHADVETTTDGGFNPSRDQAAMEKVKEKTGFAYIADSHRDQRREIREAGLVAIIYYNRGVELTRAKRYHEALLAYFRAMSLDPEFASAVKNAFGVLAKWSVELAEQGKFEDGLQVLSAGLELAPQDATMLHNRKVFWGKWADGLAASGKHDEALSVLRRAAEAVPAEARYFLAQQSWVYIRAGEALADAGKWEEALAAVEPGLKKLDKEPLKELQEWRRDVPLRWWKSLLDKKQFAQAAEVIRTYATKNADDRRLPDALCYTVQQWARDAYAKGGERPSMEVLRGQLKQSPGVAGLKELATGHVVWVAKKLQDAGKHEDALASIERNAEVVSDTKALKEITAASVDAWAAELRKAKKWEDVLTVYETALKRLPGDEHLQNNLVYMVQEGAKETYARAGDAEARAFLARAVARFPKSEEVRKVARAHVGRVAKDLMSGGKFEEALAAVDANKALLPDKAEAQELSVIVYDTWAREHLKKKQWQEALDIYARGLKQYPQEDRLRKNSVAAWNQWAGAFIAKKQWDEAIKVYEKALAAVPEDAALKNNLEYCRQQKKK